jgi:hypothetical protein
MRKAFLFGIGINCLILAVSAAGANLAEEKIGGGCRMREAERNPSYDFCVWIVERRQQAPF